MSVFKITLAATLITLGSAQIAAAQSSDNTPVFGQEISTRNVVREPIRRNVQPIEYWIEAASLNMRDNPVAGKVMGTLGYGQKVFAYEQYENWIRVSNKIQKAKWVNSDFLSNSRLSWASYTRPSSIRTTDINPVRIKDPGDRKKRMFGVRLKKSETGNALITTQVYSDQGVFFQNRFVSCEGQAVAGVRLVGEGSTYLRAQNDPRNLGLDIYGTEKIDKEANNTAEAAIASFACKNTAF